MIRYASLSLCFLLALPATAAAQRHVQYDTLAAMTPASVTCGFCGREKFGVVFRQLSGGGGLQPTSFPLTVESVELALASVQVVDRTGLGIYECVGSASGGPVDALIEIYSGITAPTGDILALPGTGPWPGETMVWSDMASVERSVAMMDGGMMYNVMFNTITLPEGTRVETPGTTYIRVVVTIPESSATEGMCHFLNPGYTEPAAVPIRDEGRLENELNFIYALETPPLLGPGLTQGWYWNEDTRISDGSGTSTIQGDWGLRLNVLPGAAMTDAGPPVGTDAGPPVGTDAGPPVGTDGGPPVEMDAGTTPMCSGDTDCAGGERCVDGTCQRLACTTATDCAGGMTCIDMMCRNLCSSDSECAGGEICDTAAGSCVPIGTVEPGGCGCRVEGSRSGGNGLAFLAGLLAVGLLARRRRSRG